MKQIQNQNENGVSYLDRIRIPKKESFVVPSGTYEAEIRSFYQKGESEDSYRLKFKIPVLETHSEIKVAAITYHFDSEGNSPFFDDMRKVFGEDLRGVSENGWINKELLKGKRVIIKILQEDDNQGEHPDPYSRVIGVFPFVDQSAEASSQKKHHRKGGNKPQ